MSKNYFFFITCLEAGGAQRAMLQLIRHIKKVESYANIHVINLSQEGEELQESLYSYSTSLINLNLKNLALYKKIIRDYEKNSLDVKNGNIFIKLNLSYICQAYPCYF